MKTKELKTGVKVTTNKRGEIVSISSPYFRDEPKNNNKYSLLIYILVIILLVVTGVYFGD